ncbi:MAG: non-lysosomal glucosylceramidase, partial [Armatimonadota bacterium]|nr:non-lysosomal glucosylceramidase [Armatimonadota bacterium]
MDQKQDGINRRDFIRVAGIGTAVLLTSFPRRLPVMAGPFDTADFEKLVPADKKLAPDWVKSLFERGARTVYRGDELRFIGMPVGGIGAGQLYLGGDGKLWHWDIFNQHIGTGAEHYANPLAPRSPLEQGFALHLTSGGQTQTRDLDQNGFADIRFSGEYPIGVVEYRDAAAPVAVTLEAFSPFIPLATDDSSLPATILHFTVKNTSNEAVEATLAGWLENAVCLYNRTHGGNRRNRIVRGNGMSFLSCTVEKSNTPSGPVQTDIVFEDWNKDSYAGWTVEGTAFGTRPIKRGEALDYQGDLGGEGDHMVNSHAAAPANSVGARDAHTGKLISRRFTIERNFINFWIGGGSHVGQTALNLVIDGKIIHSATGADDNRMARRSFDVREHKGKTAFIEIVDAATGAWGHIGVGPITFSDVPPMGKLEELSDFGTMGLALLGEPAEHALAAGGRGGFGGDASAPLTETLVGAIGRKLRLGPGQTATVTFVLTWHFPNLELKGLGKVGRYYATKFDSALAVAQYVADNFARLAAQTRLWRDTWYDSTLPYWFLDRTLLNASILATSTCFRFTNGRFYGWEGVGCCPGTCAHVWHYAHAAARLFPDLERTVREMADYGSGFDAATGRIRFRAEHNNHWAVDGQAGCILRAYREHQMSADATFLRRLWPRVKKSLEFLIEKDLGPDGIIDGPQHNTLDTDWHGEIAWLSSLYVAALRAGEQMAREMGDEPFAT